jgi:toxin ParE1/3/4
MPDIIRAPLAEQDLADIWLTIQPHNIDAANNLLRLIDKTCALLADYPKIGRDRGNILPGLFSFPVGNYLIFYRIAPGGIEIARVLHGARDIPSVFLES